MVPDAFAGADAQAAAVEFGERAGDGEAEARALVGLESSVSTYSKGRASLCSASLRDADAGVLDIDIDGVADANRARTAMRAALRA